MRDERTSEERGEPYRGFDALRFRSDEPERSSDGDRVRSACPARSIEPGSSGLWPERCTPPEYQRPDWYCQSPHSCPPPALLWLPRSTSNAQIITENPSYFQASRGCLQRVTIDDLVVVRLEIPTREGTLAWKKKIAEGTEGEKYLPDAGGPWRMTSS